jgi:putative spermidine/putrescine transport system substrate-binding protein
MAGLAGQAFAQARAVTPDGKRPRMIVIFNSSGGTYGENVVKAFFAPFEKECGIKVTQVTDARTYAQMKQYVQSGNVPWDIGGTRADQEFPLGIKEGLFRELPANFWDGIRDQMAPGSFNSYGAWSTPYSDVLIYSTKAFRRE